MYINDPREIERKSFEIISKELGERDYLEGTEDIIKRIVHTTADFEYADLIEFKNDAVEKGLEALKTHKKIYADTSMIKSGVNRKALSKLNLEIVNYVHDEDVAEESKKTGITRSTIAMKKALNDKEVGIFAIGNAPTALYTLIEAIEKENKKPALIIGAPIGFVGAAESKAKLDEIDKYKIPYIRINGRKGGSPVVAAILNAMLYKFGRDF